MTKTAIRDFILTELRWDRPPDQLRDDTALIDGRTVDSLGIVKLISFLEQQFGITLEDTEILPENFESIAAIASFVERKRSSQAAP